MDKQRLEDYIYLKQEELRLSQKISEIEGRLARIVEGGPVIDSVRGGEGNLQHYRIEGFPQSEYEKVRTQLMTRRLSLSRVQERDREELKDIEKWMYEIEDVMLRLIVQYRVIDRLEWEDVAKKLGGGNTADGVRMQYNRIFWKKK